MSGYLQRLVNRTAGRPNAIHPRTGSIFSPPRDDAPTPLQPTEETETATAAQPRAQQQAPPAGVSHAEPRQYVTRELAYVPLVPAAEAPARDAAFSGPPASRAVVSDGGEPIAARVLKPGEPPRDSHDAAGAETPIALQPARRADNPVRPLTNANRTGDVAARSAEPRHVPRDRHANRVERQPDDIQIHIGRIEVVAVAPPPPRVPKAPDRSLSLDEYLSRRDRRPR
jgi:hypothetical protein